MLTTARLRSLTLACVLLLLLGLNLQPAQPALAIGGTIAVNNTGDSLNDGNSNTCTLREALQGASLAKGNPSPQPYAGCSGYQTNINTITFAAISGQTITVGNTLPFISSNVTLTGPIILNGSGAANTPMIRVATSEGILNMAAVTMTKGEPAILGDSSSAIINIAGSSFVGNTNPGNGGAISSVGKLNIAGSNFTGNRSDGSDGGGAIHAGGSDAVAIAGSVFNGNIAKRSGGAIYAGAPGIIVDTIFNGNIAEGLDPNNNGTEGDPADDYFPTGGGAISNHNDGANDRKMEIVRSVFNGNLAVPKANAGAVYNHSGAVVEIRDSSFNGNLAGSTGLDRLGGAIVNASAKLDINGATFLNNGVTGNGGALSIDRGNVVTLTNVTIVANAATGSGGGIYAFNSQQGSDIRADLTLRNVTISLNASTDGGGIYGQAPSSSYPEPHKLANTILADNVPANCGGGAFTSLGTNLDSGTSCGLTATGDLQGANAALQAPSFNGGPLADLLTQKLGGGSAALDSGNPAICAADPVAGVDQRGESRGGDGDGNGVGGCDIGAYEGGAVKAGYGSTPVQPGPIDIGNVQLGTTGQKSFTILSTGNKDLTVSAALVGPNAAEFAVVSFPSTIVAGGSAAATLSCSPAGAAGGRVATLNVITNDPDRPAVSYDLLCNATPEPVPGYGSTPDAPGPIDLGTALVGQARLSVLTVRETGNATLTVNTATITGPNAADFNAGAVNLTLPDGAADVPLLISCAPSAPGIRTATLSFVTNDPANATVSYALSCTGVLPPNPVLASGTAVADPFSPPEVAAGPYGVALSPDGRNLYVANELGNALMIYDRNTTTGALTNARPIDFLDGVRRVMVSQDGGNVYVTLTEPTEPASTGGQVRAYSRNLSTGDLNFLDSVSEGETGSIRGLSRAYGMALSSDGKYLYVAGNSDTGAAANDNTSIIVLSRSADGGLASGGGPNFVSRVTSAALEGTYDLAISPDGAHLYAANYSDNPDSIAIFDRNAATGALTTAGSITATSVPALAGVFRLELSADGTFIYASSYDSDAIVLLQRNPATGALSHVASYTDGGTDTLGRTIDGLDQASSAKISPDGRYLFTSGHGDHALTVFERDSLTGRLTFVETVKRNPSDINVSGIPPLGQARDIAVADNSRHVYVSGYADDYINFFPFANPLPTLSSLSPASAAQGSAAIEVTVSGSGFVSGVSARIGALPMITTFVSASELRVTIPATQLTSAGLRTVTAINPLPGGGTSNGLTFTVTAPADNPVPSIEQLAPQGSEAGAPAVLVTVSGSGYLPTSKAYWNGAERATTYISGSALQMQVTAEDLAQPGTAAVTVVNPAPGGGSSNPVGYTVAAPGQNPPPSLDHASPASTVAAQSTGLLVIDLYGAGFVTGAQAQWDGVDRPTTYIDDTHLQLELNAADVASAGQHSIVVVNPAPGGGPSNAVAFTVVAVGTNPLPSVGTVTVARVNTDGTIVLALDGFGFVAGAQARWSGADRATVVASPTRLEVTISTADYQAGSAVVSVVNPGPGGGASNDVLFFVQRRALPLVIR